MIAPLSLIHSLLSKETQGEECMIQLSKNRPEMNELTKINDQNSPKKDGIAPNGITNRLTNRSAMANENRK